jgi:hypothetical protein
LACGTCCNSPPLLSLPELFHHQHVFLGVLGIRGIRRIAPGDAMGTGSDVHRASAEDCAGLDQITPACLHRLRAGPLETPDFFLALQGFDDGPCPALGQDGRCTVHADRKPAGCAAVPLDPLLPDRLQHLVLAERWAESDDLGSRCIRRAVVGLTVHGPDVVDEEARRALAARREDLAAEKRHWGEAVFRQLAAAWMADPAGLARISGQAFLVIPLVPVLSVVAGASARCRERCLEFLDAQIVLAETSLARDRTRPPETAARLRGILRADLALRASLLAQPQVDGQGHDDGNEGEIEAWLGLGDTASRQAP